MVGTTGRKEVDAEVSDSSEEEAEEDENEAEEHNLEGFSAGMLERRVRDFLLLRYMEEQLGSEHPFVSAQRTRIMRVRHTLLLDLNAALKQARNGRNDAKSMKIIGLYRDMDAAKEAVEVLKASKR